MILVKKIHIYLFVTILVLTPGCEITDSDSPDPQDTFVKYYGFGGTQVGIDLEYDGSGPGTTGESMIILGSNVPSGEADRNVIVRRVDLAGNELDFAEYDFTDPVHGGGDDEPGSILVEDGRLVIVGTSSREGVAGPYSVVFILELNEELDSVRSKVIGEAGYQLKGRDVVRVTNTNNPDINLDPDGDLIVTGSSNFEELGDPLRNVANPDDETQIFIARVAMNQDSVVWRRTRGFTGNDEGIYIDEFAPNNFVIIGSSDRDRSDQGRNVILLPINEVASPSDGVAEGFIIDAQEDFDDVATAVFKRPAGYVVTGVSSKTGAANRPIFVNFTYTSAEIVTMDRGKEILLNDMIGQEGKGYGIALGRNGNYVVVGEYLNFGGTGGKNSEIFVTQLDQTGAEIVGSTRNYGLVAGSDIGEDVVVIPNGDIMVLSTVDFGSGNSLLGLMRLNQSGDIAQ